MLIRRAFLHLIFIALLSASTGHAQAQIPTTNFRYLAADPSLRAELSGAAVRMGQATYVGKVLEMEENWETDFDLAYPGSVVTNPASGKLRMYYELAYTLNAPHHNNRRLVGLAESDDGINWTKPALNITGDRYSDNPLNNFIDVQDRQWPNSPCVFIDPNAPPQERYKMSYHEFLGVFRLAASDDGLHFHDIGVADTPPNGLDSLNITFWDPKTRQYQAYMRYNYPYDYPDPHRGVTAKRSSTWEGTWQGPREYTIDPVRDSLANIYTPGVMPYHGQYIGLPAMFYADTTGSLYPTFMHSRDGSQWHFEDSSHPVIDLAAHGQTVDDFGAAYPATSLVERDGKLWIYYSYGHDQHDAPNHNREKTMHLATIRQDGFVAIEPEAGQLGTWTTSAIQLPQWPAQLLMNAEVTGSLGVEVLDPNTMNPLAGFTAAEVLPIGQGDYLDVAAAWRDADGLGGLGGREVVLRFSLDDASIYSFSFTSEIPQAIDSIDFEWKYEFDADLPTVSDLDTNGTGDFNVNVNGGAITLADDVLKISCPEKSNVAYYYSGWGEGDKIWDVAPDLDLEHGVTVEMSVKVDGEAEEGSQGATGIAVMPDGTNVDAKLYIGKTGQWWGEENYINFQQLGEGTYDNTDAFHAFRVALDPDTETYSVWRDTELLGSGLGDTDSRDGLRRLVFGTYASSLTWGDVDIEYVRFTSGVYAPEASTPDLPGDANGDGAVDVSDLGILATYYGTIGGAGWENGDFSGDGNVDVSDLGILATNYGSVAAQAVPEPSTLGMLLIGALTLIWRRRG